MRYRLTPVVGLAASIAMPACGDDEVTLGSVGRAEAVIRDDPDRSTPSAIMAGGPFAVATFSGTVTSNTDVAISANGQTRVVLGSPDGITFSLQSGDSTTVHGEADVPVGTSARVRMTLRNAQAKLLAGGSVAGLTLTSDVTMTLGGSDGEVVIEKCSRLKSAPGRARPSCSRSARKRGRPRRTHKTGWSRTPRSAVRDGVGAGGGRVLRP